MKLTNTILYFGYGANTSEDRLKKRKLKYISREKAILKDYKIEFSKPITSSRPWVKGSAASTIVRDYGAQVEGFLYEVPVKELLKLDEAEGYPNHYGKGVVSVICSDGTTKTAIVYMANETVSDLKPCKKYIETILENREELSEQYVKFLENLETID
jgi:cation transport regulator ChaC